MNAGAVAKPGIELGGHRSQDPSVHAADDSTFRALARSVIELRARHDRACIAVRRHPSSHLLARKLVAEYRHDQSPLPELDVVAYEQTGGVGRHGDRWHSPAGAGAWVSLLRRVEAARAPLLPTSLAVALATALDPWLGERCRLKWPNDLMVGDRKLGGILIDVGHRGDEWTRAVLSFGVNLWTPPNVPVPATSLSDESDRPPNLAELINALTRSVDRILAADPAAIVSEYQRRSAHREGDEMTCRQGDSSVHGRFVGFDQQGCLRLEVDGHRRRLCAGELIEAGVPTGPSHEA